MAIVRDEPFDPPSSAAERVSQDAGRAAAFDVRTKRGRRRLLKLAQYAALGIIFALLATANGAGYRYGVSDQAFYIPVVVRALNPDAFPQDAALIDAQGRLMLSDEVLAAIVRTTGLH